MDGGSKQTAMSSVIREQIRRDATARQETAFTVEVFTLSRTQDSQQQSIQVAKQSSDPSGLPLTHSEVGAIVPAETPLDLSALDDTHAHFLTLYLDTVFPSLFPWYQPSDLTGGRGWLLSIMRQNQAVFHTAMSVSSSYFTMFLAVHANHTLRTPCEQHVWDILAAHMDLSVRAMRGYMEDLGKEQNSKDLTRKTHIMYGIMLFLIFEVNMTNQPTWGIHLRAASTLFEEILQQHKTQDDLCHLDTILQAMERPSIFEGTNFGFRVWNTDQAAFQFSSALLIYADVISSVSLRQEPQLQRYHKLFITVADDPRPHGRTFQHFIKLESYVGCQGRVLILIGKISALEAHRYSSHDGDPIFKEEMTQQAQDIRREIRDIMVAVNGDITSSLRAETRSSAQRLHLQDATQHSHRLTLGTKIWLHAAMIYLETVVNGWDLPSPTISGIVESVLEVLGETSLELSLRSLIWPLCVTGCVAMEDQEDKIRSIMSSIGPLKGFAVAKDALQIVERVWQVRHRLDRGSWGLADCFDVDGYKYLLI